MNQYRPSPVAYVPGLHCLADITVSNPSKLENGAELQLFWNQLVADLGLTQVGEVFHQFEEGGFTAVVCLTESHLSIHTWPEHGYATMDVFLSNYKQVNDRKAEAIVEATAAFLGAVSVNLNQHNR